jgi:type VI secretion system secreted protein VgrG
MDSAASINWATPASTVLHAGRQLHWTTQSDFHFTAAHTMSSVAGNAAGFFTHAGGIQAIAGNGAVSLQAHTDQLEIVADKEVVVISVNDCIEIQAKDKIVLQAGQSAVTLQGGDITFACPGTFSVKGGQHVFDGGSTQAAVLDKLPDTRLKLFDEAFVVKDPDGLPVAGLRYRIALPDGTFEDGVTDEFGQTHVVAGADPHELKLYVTKGDI